MKKGIIIYHSNIKHIHKSRWTSKCINSIINQSDNDFTFYEINYGDDDESVIPHDCNIEKRFWSIKLSNYAEASNFILDRAFEDGCDYVFNTNVDDYYDTSRISKQVKMMKDGYDISSSDFCYIEEFEDRGLFDDKITLLLNIHQYGNIRTNLEGGHNVIANPAVCYSKNFWNDSNNRYDITKVPADDYDLWLRSIRRGFKFGIHKDILLYYRRHYNQASVLL